MPKLSATEQVRSWSPPADDLVWTECHYDWLRRSSSGRVVNDVALAHIRRVMLGDDIPKREGEQRYRFSGSKANAEHGEGFGCHRAALFSYAGLPKLAPTPDQQDNMDQGNFLHLQYQVEGLSAGYLTSCETWDFDPELRYGMKDDGILADGSLWEAKFVNDKKFDAILHGNRQWAQPPGPLMDHIMQITGGMMLKGLTVTSIVYFNKVNGQFKEYRVPLQEQYAERLIRIIDDLIGWVDLNELPTILEGCRTGVSYLANNCEFRAICPGLTRLFPA